MGRRIGCGTLLVGTILALVSAGSGWWLFSNVNRLLTHETIDAIIIGYESGVNSDGNATVSPIYEYDVDGTTYRYTSQVSYSGFTPGSVGESRTLLYNPDNPQDARVRNLFLLLGLPGIVSVVALAIVGLVGRAAVRRSRRDDAFPAATPAPHPAWGEPVESALIAIEADFMGAEPSQMDSAGVTRYRVKARTEIDGGMHRFVGDWMDNDPTLILMEHGNKVEVRIDPSDPSSYEVIVPNAD
ncbi:MAG: DUF3592 domain-containing protein [Actinomycetota bacterium]|nr:DUF3592 domain-containing protein [Actinomycetota bacterium]